MKIFTSVLLLSTLLLSNVNAFAPVPSASIKEMKSYHISSPRNMKNNFNDEMEASVRKYEFPASDDTDTNNNSPLPLIPVAAAMTMMPFPAEAAGAEVIPSALAAYAHYLSLFAIVGLITYERITVEANMTKEKEMNLAVADIGVGVMGVAILASGYFRATQYGKGWYFYSHEPIFWLKMVFLCIFGAASLFPTVTFIKRSVAIQQGKELEPMSEKLAGRLQQVLNAELVMLASIPLAATLMSRGVAYTESIPFNVIGPVLCAITAGGLGFKYVKEAITWEEPKSEPVAVPPAAAAAAAASVASTED